MNKNQLGKNLFFIVFVILCTISCKKYADNISDNKLNDDISKSNAALREIQPEIVRFSPDPVIAGDSTEIFIKLSRSAPAGGIIVTIDKVRSAGPVVDLPKSFTIAAGKSTGSTFIKTVPYKDNIYEYISARLPNFASASPIPLNIVPRPKNDSRPPLQVFEAENAYLKGVKAVKAIGFYKQFFSNEAYAEFSNTKQSYARFTVTPLQAGMNVVEIRYAWSTSDDQQPTQLNVMVNNIQYPLIFTPTANNFSNNLIYINANLKPGKNQIYVGTNNGNANKLRLDNVTIAVP